MGSPFLPTREMTLVFLTRAKLFELEKMERKLVQGQEAATHRKEALEREYNQRLTDAQVSSSGLFLCYRSTNCSIYSPRK